MLKLLQVAEQLNVSVQTVRSLVESGDLVAIAVGSRKCLSVLQNDLDTFISSRRRYKGKDAPALPKTKTSPFKFLDGARLSSAWKRRDAERDGQCGRNAR